MFLEIILSLAAISFFSIFAIRPTFLTISTLLKEVSSKKETLTKMDTKINNLQTAQQILGQESSRIPIVDLSVPTLPQPQIFVHQIEGAAATAQVQILGIRVDETPLKGTVPAKNAAAKDVSGFPVGVNGMGFSVSATGSFQNLFTFLKDLEDLRSPVKISILGISLSKVERGNILTLVVTGMIPYLGGEK